MPKFLTRRFDTSVATQEAANPPSALRMHRPENRRLAVWGSLSALAIIAALTIGVWAMVRRSTYSLASSSLRSLLSANAAALNLYFDDRSSDVTRLLARPDVKSAAQQLLKTAGTAQFPDAGGRGADIVTEDSAPADIDAVSQRLHAACDADSFDKDYLGWVVINLRGRVVASSRPALRGHAFSLDRDTLKRLISGSATVSRPLETPIALTDEGPLAKPGGPVMLAVAPVSSGERLPMGGLGLLINPFGDYAALLEGGWTGRSGEVFVVDDSGRLISPSRFEEQLRQRGLLNAGKATSMLQVEASETIRRRGTGINVRGFTDYRGARVIGAWQWLPEYDRSIVVKRDYDEAYRPVEIIRLAFLLLTGLLLLAAVAAAVLTWLYRRSVSQASQANRRARRLGHYELGELLGYGGMGAVYRGKHSQLCRDVAVKVLEGDQATEQSVARFKKEVRQTARLQHPNTINIYDYGHTADGTFFYVMEYIDGITLQQLVDYYGPQPHHRVIDLLIQICGSLSEAHAEGLIHRDVKPSNVLLTARAGLYDVVKVLDFGLVREIEGQIDSLTRTESLTGTPLYIAPESIRNASAATPRSDIYSVGAVAYTLLTGHGTFRGESAVDLCFRQLNEDPPRPSERLGRHLPDDLQNIVMSCLRRDPDQRPNSMEELADTLRACRQCYQWTASDARHWWEEVFEESHRGPIDTGLPTIIEGNLVGVQAQAYPFDTQEGTAD